MSTHYIEEAERLADTVAVMSAGQIIAQGTPAELVAAHAGREVVEVYGPPAELAELEELAAEREWRYRRSGPAVALLGAERARRRGARGSPPAGQPRGRVRRADRTGDRMSAARAERPSSHRLDPAALAGVMTRDVVLFRRYWKATTFSSIVQPTIYLLAFGLGFGSLLHNVGHVTLRRVRRDRRGRHRGPVLVGVPGDVQHVHPLAVPAHLRRAAGGAGRRRGAGHRRDPVDLDPGRYLRDGAARGRDRVRADAERGHAPGAADRLRHRASGSPASAS